LRAIARAALVEFDRPVDPATGEPEELDELVSLVARVRASPVWDRVRTARRVLVETPFSFAVSGDEARRLGIVDPAPAELVEGVIDLALQDNDGRWTLIDFKTGSVPDARAKAVYAAQLRLYAEGMRRGGGGGPTAVP
jgi:ATP-dependent exoDNAse (exonuclease V) beta subunit